MIRPPELSARRIVALIGSRSPRNGHWRYIFYVRNYHRSALGLDLGAAGFEPATSCSQSKRKRSGGAGNLPWVQFYSDSESVHLTDVSRPTTSIFFSEWFQHWRKVPTVTVQLVPQPTVQSTQVQVAVGSGPKDQETVASTSAGQQG